VPSKEDIRRMDKIVGRGFRIDLKPAEKELFFTFRHYLVQDKKYLPYFLNSLPHQYNDEA
jgi:hypothetical protein